MVQENAKPIKIGEESLKILPRQRISHWTTVEREALTMPLAHNLDGKNPLT